MKAVRAIPSTVEAPEAARIVSRAAGRNGRAEAERRLFYPYYCSVVRHTTRSLLGSTALGLSCLVDARTGVASTADAFATSRLDAPDADVLEPLLDAGRSRALAERYAGYVLRRRRSSLSFRQPALETTKLLLVHKPFWIVRCSREDATFPVLVDGVTGRFHVLRQSRAS